MTTAIPDTDHLHTHAGAGDAQARNALRLRHCDRLRRMVAGRFAPSHAVEDVLVKANRKLDAYLQERPLPFYLWLRQLAIQHLTDLHRRDIRAGKQVIEHEEHALLPLADESAAEVADRLVTSRTSASERAVGEELRQRVQQALRSLNARARELLELRHLEQLSVVETAAVPGIRPEAVKVQALRALEPLRTLLDQSPDKELT